MKQNIIAILFVCLSFVCAASCHNSPNVNDKGAMSTSAQQSDTTLQLTFKNTIFDFGKVSADSSEIRCTFEYVNETNKTMAILNVSSSCSCVSAKWDTAPIRKGDKGVITVIFKNNQGEKPFDKALQVRTTTFAKPVTLRVRGDVVR